MLASTCLLFPALAVRCHPQCTSDGDSLSLEALRGRLRDTWRSLCEGADQGAARGVGVGEWASRNLLTTRLDGLALNRVHLAESGIEGAGAGVFASRDLQVSCFALEACSARQALQPYVCSGGQGKRRNPRYPAGALAPLYPGRRVSCLPS